jgi:hypothetical protein
MTVYFRNHLTALVVLVACCATGCGGAAAALPHVSPDEKLGRQIRESSGTTAPEAVAETATETASATAWGSLTGKFVYDGSDPTPGRLAITKASTTWSTNR